MYPKKGQDKVKIKINTYSFNYSNTRITSRGYYYLYCNIKHNYMIKLDSHRGTVSVVKMNVSYRVS